MEQLYTRWGRDLDPENLPDIYPRGLLQRGSWISLNGYWDYSIVPAIQGKNDAQRGYPAWAAKCIRPKKYDGKILVPFSPESVLSGVNRQLKPGEILWYHRILPEVHPKSFGRRLLLRFGAVDQSCVVFLNGEQVGRHMGGYLPFDLDITDRYVEGEVNELVVKVRDVSDTSFHAKGKQMLKRGGMFYTAVSGIWQTVWMEEVPEEHIEEIEIVPEPDADLVHITVHANAQQVVKLCIDEPSLYINENYSQMADALVEKIFVAGTTNECITVRIPKAHLWTCEKPWIYNVEAQMGSDYATSYFAMRTVTIEKDEEGIPRICLNHEKLFLRGILDQGMWPDGLYTPPSDEAILFDLRGMKAAGFNMVRKHAKIEPDRWYYHCDHLGLLVWQDIVNGGEPYHMNYVTYAAALRSWMGLRTTDTDAVKLARQSDAGKEEFRQEIAETARTLKGHPSVFAWTLFNEAWGQFETKACTEILRNADPERLIDSASGWFDQNCGDFRSVHYYYLTFSVKPEKERAFVLSEFGGLPYRIREHAASRKLYGYGKKFKDEESLTIAYNKLIDRMKGYESEGLCAYVYTQWTDIEDEVNGLYTYDREILKIRNGES